MLKTPLSSLSVMVIDDVDETRALLCDMLSELGFSRFLHAQNGRDALCKLKDFSVSLILCDNVMDEMSGVEFLREVRRTPEHTETPVIFVSAVGAVPQVEEAITLGATDYLVKPVSFRKLRRTVESALRTGTGTLPPVRYEIEA